MFLLANISILSGYGGDVKRIEKYSSLAGDVCVCSLEQVLAGILSLKITGCGTRSADRHTSPANKTTFDSIESIPKTGKAQRGQGKSAMIGTDF